MRVPDRQQAAAFLAEAEALNPGPWVAHTRLVAQAAEAIAGRHPDLDSDVAWVLGCLHDIGRRAGRFDLRHLVDGYRFLAGRGFDIAARICITHGFVIRDANITAGTWDCPVEDFRFARDFLAGIEYDEYDRLIQLCDLLALPEGFCLIEKRLIEVALRRGVNRHSVPRWRAMLELRTHFERVIGQSVYSLLPGVVESTFGQAPQA